MPIEFPFLPLHLRLPSHPKILKFKRQHGPGSWQAIIGLWFWVALNRPDGDLSGMTDEEIEVVSEWRGTPGGMVASLKDCVLIDGEAGSYRVHDWTDWQEHFAQVHERQADALRKRISRRSERPETSENVRQAPDIPGRCPAPLKRRGEEIREDQRREDQRREDQSRAEPPSPDPAESRDRASGGDLEQEPRTKRARRPKTPAAAREPPDTFQRFAAEQHNKNFGNPNPPTWKAWGPPEWRALADGEKRLGREEAERRWTVYLETAKDDRFFEGLPPRKWAMDLNRWRNGHEAGNGRAGAAGSATRKAEHPAGVYPDTGRPIDDRFSRVPTIDIGRH